MKITLFFIYLLFPYSTFALNYYVDSTNGSDTNDGTSINSAWKSIERVNIAQLHPSDSILFKRGEIFRGNLIPISGSASGSVTYAAYGTGNKPKLLGSVQKKSNTDWISESPNIWISKLTNKPKSSEKLFDVGNIIFNNEAFCGIKVNNETDLNAQGKFWSDINNQALEIYSVSNPAVYYSNMEIALKPNIISIGNKNYITFQNLDLRYGAAHGIAGPNTHHIVIREVDFSYIGGGFLYGMGDGKGRYGNGVEFGGIAHDNLVEKCSFNQIYDAALTAQGAAREGGFETYNIYFRNNIIRNCEYSFELWGRGPDAYLHDIYFENNTCLYAGYGWGHAQRSDPNGTHLILWTFTAESKNIYVMNNIFYESSDWGSRANISELSKVICDYNCWYQSSGPIAKVGNKKFDFTKQWSDYKSISGQDSHSIAADPILLPNFMPAKNSPCIGAGTIIKSGTDSNKTSNQSQIKRINIGAF